MDLRTKKILPETFARITNHTANWVRVSMQKGLLPIGTATKMKECNKRWTYDIRPNLAANYLGLSVAELIELVKECEKETIA